MAGLISIQNSCLNTIILNLMNYYIIVDCCNVIGLSMFYRKKIINL